MSANGHSATNGSATEGQSSVTRADVNGCWSNTGVYGDGTCLELQKFVHCRNCPVYSSAGVTLIDRPLPANYRKDWAQHFAQKRQLPEAGNSSAILFKIQNDWLAVSTHSFQEVAEKRPIHSLPHHRGGIVLGLANVRGELVICISVGHLLQIESIPSLVSVRLDYRRLLVIQSETSRLAFPVDEVQGPHRFHPQELKSAPASAARSAPQFLHGFLHYQGKSVGLLDTDYLFSTLQHNLS